MNDDLGALLKTHRCARGWTLREAAARVGVAFQTLDAWERGRAVVSWDRLQAWAYAFDLEPILLLQPRGRGDGASGLPLSESQRALRGEIETKVAQIPDEVAAAIVRWIRLETGSDR